MPDPFAPNPHGTLVADQNLYTPLEVVEVGYPDGLLIVTKQAGDLVEGSQDGTNWVQLGSSADAGTVGVLRLGRVRYRYIRCAQAFSLQSPELSLEKAVEIGPALVVQTVNPYDCDNKPTMANSKADILQWFLDAGDPQPGSLTKAQLLDIADIVCP